MKLRLEQQADAAGLSTSALVVARLNEPGLPLNLKAVLDARAEVLGVSPRALQTAIVTEALAKLGALEFCEMDAEAALEAVAPAPGMQVVEIARRLDAAPGGQVYGAMLNAFACRHAHQSRDDDGTMQLKAVKPKKKS